MSFLKQVTKGKVIKPYYLLMHGIPGIGKSTFGAEAPNPIFLCAEEGTSHLDVARLELKSFPEFMSTLKELLETEHEYESIVVDTVDHLEPLIWEEVCKDKNKKSIEDIGYAKGYIFALEYWKQFTDSLEELRAKKKMNVILLAHTDVKSFNDPQLTEPYDRYQVKLHHKAAGHLIDRVEDVLFVNYKAFINKSDNGKTKALGDGSRVVYTEHRPAFVAKNRHDLPFEIPLSFGDFARLAESEKNVDPKAILQNINTLLPDVKDAKLKEKIEKHLEVIKENSMELLKVENRLKTIVSAA
jgi:hypothetical protein